MDREVEIKFKRSKLSPNPRVAKLRDTGFLYHAMLHAAELKFNIEKIATESNKSIGELETTTIPTDLLWFLADTYLDAYNMLQKEDLIKSGNIHKISQTLH